MAQVCQDSHSKLLPAKVTQSSRQAMPALISTAPR